MIRAVQFNYPFDTVSHWFAEQQLTKNQLIGVYQEGAVMTVIYDDCVNDSYYPNGTWSIYNSTATTGDCTIHADNRNNYC